MAVYTVQQVAEAGTLGTYTAVSATDTFTPLNDQPHILHVKNAGASSDTVTVDDPNSVSPVAATAFNADQTGAVANATDRFFRILPVRTKNTGTGVITVTHSFTTSVTAAVFVA